MELDVKVAAAVSATAPATDNIPNHKNDVACVGAASSVCPHLPPELWSKVLMNVEDPFELWTACRQVSKTLMVQSEYAFRKLFLPRLTASWFYLSSEEEDLGEIRMKASLDEAASDPTSSTAYFKLVVEYHDIEDDIKLFTEQCNSMVITALNYKDIDYLRRWELQDTTDVERADSQPDDIPRHVLSIALENNNPFLFYVNDAGLSDIQIHLQPEHLGVYQRGAAGCGNIYNTKGHISFDWKALTSKFFAEEIYVRHRQPTPKTPGVLESLIAETKNWLRSRCDYSSMLQGPRVSRDGYFEAKHQFIMRAKEIILPEQCTLERVAYRNRLRRSCEAAGVDFDEIERNSTALSSSECIARHMFRLRDLKYQKALAGGIAKMWRSRVEDLEFLEQKAPVKTGTAATP